jgi:hypothetical protein
MKLLYDQEMLEDAFMIKWQNRRKKLDRDCKLSDRKAETLYRELIAPFISWLE